MFSFVGIFCLFILYQSLSIAHAGLDLTILFQPLSAGL
jgi:hypothetical protein